MYSLFAVFPQSAVFPPPAFCCAPLRLHQPTQLLPVPQLAAEVLIPALVVKARLARLA